MRSIENASEEQKGSQVLIFELFKSWGSCLDVNKLEMIIRQLPPELQKEVEDFVLFLLEKKANKRKKESFLKQDWAGGLKEYRNIYTSFYYRFFFSFY